jgi:Fis family transcriptional regulator, factor for inversion stimulation protein
VHSLTPEQIDGLAFEDLVRAKLRSVMRLVRGQEVGDLWDQVMQRVERPLIELALERCGGNRVRAARLLGVNRNTLRRKMHKLGVAPE